MGLNNLAQLLHDTNRLGEAESLMRRALEIWEISFGKDHPQVAFGLGNLSALLRDTNRFGEAEQLIRRSLAILEVSFGKDHPKVATALNTLALLLQATNRLGEAEPLMRRHLEIFLKFTRTSERQHPHLMGAFNNYGGLLMAMGKTQVQAMQNVTALAKSYGVLLRPQ